MDSRKLLPKRHHEEEQGADLLLQSPAITIEPDLATRTSQKTLGEL